MSSYSMKNEFVLYKLNIELVLLHGFLIYNKTNSQMYFGKEVEEWFEL